MASYRDFTSARTTEPDFAALVAALRVVDPTAGPVVLDVQRYRVKTANELTAQQVRDMQTAIDSAPAVTPQRLAQNEIDRWPIAQRALVLALIDQLNVIRARLSPPLPAITAAQALDAVRDKAGTLQPTATTVSAARSPGHQ